MCLLKPAAEVPGERELDGDEKGANMSYVTLAMPLVAEVERRKSPFCSSPTCWNFSDDQPMLTRQWLGVLEVVYRQVGSGAKIRDVGF